MTDEERQKLETAPRVRHIKRGTSYQVITRRATIQTAEPLDDLDYVVVYRGDDGQIWVRPVAEFYDGRFEVI